MEALPLPPHLAEAQSAAPPVSVRAGACHADRYRGMHIAGLVRVAYLEADGIGGLPLLPLPPPILLPLLLPAPAATAAVVSAVAFPT